MQRGNVRAVGGRRIGTVVCALASVLVGATGTAGAAVRVGSVEDPADRPGEADVAAATVRYDDAGTLSVSVRFHAPVAADDATTIDWSVTRAVTAGGCGDTRDGLAGLLELRSGEGTLTYAEVPEDGVPVEVEIPARQTLSADRRQLSVTAGSASLGRRSFRCSEIALSNGDDVPAIMLSDGAPGAPSTGPPDIRIDPDRPRPAGRVRGLRVSRARLSFDRSGRWVTASLRALVCGPHGTRFVAEVRERRRRSGGRDFSPVRVHTYRSRQRVTCHEHRWSWRFRGDPAVRYQVRARLLVRSPVSTPP